MSCSRLVLKGTAYCRGGQGGYEKEEGGVVVEKKEESKRRSSLGLYEDEVERKHAAAAGGKAEDLSVGIDGGEYTNSVPTKM